MKMGRLGGIEPPSQAPQACILTVVRQSPALDWQKLEPL